MHTIYETNLSLGFILFMEQFGNVFIKSLGYHTNSFPSITSSPLPQPNLTQHDHPQSEASHALPVIMRGQTTVKISQQPM